MSSILAVPTIDLMDDDLRADLMLPGSLKFDAMATEKGFKTAYLTRTGSLVPEKFAIGESIYKDRIMFTEEQLYTSVEVDKIVLMDGEDPVVKFRSKTGEADLIGGKLFLHGASSSNTGYVETVYEGERPIVSGVATSAVLWKSYHAFTPGSLANASNGMVRYLLGKSAVSGVSPSTAMAEFSSVNHTTPAYVRNTSCWASLLDLTGVSVWNSADGMRRGGTLITNRHVIYAHHFPLSHGSTLRFVTKDNEVVTRTLTASARAGSTDIRVGLLNEDIPDSLAVYPLLPDGYLDRIPYLTDASNNVNQTVHIPMLTLNRNKHVFVLMAHKIEVPWWSTEPHVHIMINPAAAWDDISPYSFDLESGDSGQPMFLVLEDQLILVGAHHYAPAAMSYSEYIDLIENAIASLGVGRSLTFADLTSWPNYES